MLCVRTYEDLCQETIYNRNQFWYYVIIFNPKDLTPASIKLLDNLYYFHKDSGADCVYFIPGFINTTEGISKINIDFGGPHDNFEIPKYGTVQFYVDDFLDCYKKIEENNAIQWRYSGECELLLFNLDKNGKIIPNDFAAYNLDDIIRNNRTITPFIRYTINLGKDAYDKIVAKRDLDNFYAELIMPSFNDFSEQTIRDMLGTMRDGGFQKDNYYFLSYSSKDYKFVYQIRNAIERAGIKCWMAPRDIPHGMNYAHIIELAIQNAQQFIIILSNSSIWSVWVEKELLRAIHYFQHEHSDKIVAVWLNHQIDLDATPMAYPVEGIQIRGCLSSVDDYRILLPDELQKKLKMQDKIKQSLNYFETNLVTSTSLQKQFTKLLSIALSIKNHINYKAENPLCNQFNNQCNQLKLAIQNMENLSEEDENYCAILHSAFKLENEILQAIKQIEEICTQN